MSKSEVLYVKGMNISESDGDDDDQWDDKKLNDAYDKAVKIANVEVAKRVAMSTNTPSSTVDSLFYSIKKKPSEKSSLFKKKMPIPKIPEDIGLEKATQMNWKPGMPCRLVYVEDGLEYEAVFLCYVDADKCVVKYLGYNNQEIVPVESLKPSLGKDARARQIEEASREQNEDSYGSQSPNLDRTECSDRVPSPDSIGRSPQKKKRPSKKKKHQPRNGSVNGFELPEMPPLPNLAMLRNQLGSTEMPMPPPPMTFSSMDRTDSEEQAISSMLLSWYMSGYYTGLYQGLKRAKEGHNNQAGNRM